MKGECENCGAGARELDIVFVCAMRGGPQWPEAWCSECVAEMRRQESIARGER